MSQKEFANYLYSFTLANLLENSPKDIKIDRTTLKFMESL